MTTPLDETHRADLISWVRSAQAPDTDFPIQNLPLGVFQTSGSGARPGIGIGAAVLDLTSVAAQGFLSGELASIVSQCQQDGALNPRLLNDTLSSSTPYPVRVTVAKALDLAHIQGVSLGDL